MRQIAILAFAALSISACANRLTEAECLNGDWNGIGYNDGVDGFPPSKVDDRFEECSRFDVALDVPMYERGRQDGIEVFCSPQGALDAGVRRVGDINLCPVSASFSRIAYGVGRDYSDARSNLIRLENSYRYEQRTISELRYRIRRIWVRIRDAESNEERDRLFGELRYARNRLDRAIESLYYYRSLLPRAEFEFRRAEDAYFDIRSEITGMARDQMRREMLEDSLDIPATEFADSDDEYVGEDWEPGWNEGDLDESALRNELSEELGAVPGDEAGVEFPDIMETP